MLKLHHYSGPIARLEDSVQVFEDCTSIDEACRSFRALVSLAIGRFQPDRVRAMRARLFNEQGETVATFQVMARNRVKVIRPI